MLKNGETDFSMAAEQWEHTDPLREKELSSSELRELQEANEKLIREREELEKNLVKEQFFKKLLEKELDQLKNQETPAEIAADQTAAPFYYRAPRKRFRRAGLFILFLLIAVVGGFAAYTLYTKHLQKKYLSSVSGVSPAILPNETTEVGEGRLSKESTTDTSAEIIAADPAKLSQIDTILFQTNPSKPVVPPVTEQAPNNINKTENPVSNNSNTKQQENAPVKNEQRPETIVTPQPTTQQPALPEKTLTPAPVATAPVVTVEKRPTPAPAPIKTAETPVKVTSQPEAPSFPDAVKNETPLENRKPVGFYKVISKANFYTEPNENSLSGFFIYQFNPVTLEALSDTSGFIYVIATNNLGTVSKGWLSKKDLRRIDK